MQRAGFPISSDCGGTSFVTTAPAEITDPEPMLMPGAITAPCAIQTSSAGTGKDDHEAFESRSGFDHDRNRLRLLHPLAQLVRAVVQHLAPRPDPASVADNHLRAGADVELSRLAGGVEADTVPDAQRPRTVDPDVAHNRRRRTQLRAAPELHAGN